MINKTSQERLNRIHHLKTIGRLFFLSAMIYVLSCIISCHPAEHSDNVLIGNWLGAINSDVHVYYQISRKWDGSLMGYNGIIEFNLSGGPVEVVTLNQDTVQFEELESNQRFTGTLNRDSLTIRGKYTNLNINASWPLNLKLIDSLPQPPRPQTPKKPYPYREEEVVYKNKTAGINIAGTLTLPDKKGTFPCVLLITGSGQQNRDEEMAFHHPFLVIADHLTRNGIAVLRVDDRGVGGTTRTGPFFNSTTKDLEGDVLAGVQYLRSRKEINPGKIGLIGHSEGGLIASMAAAESPDIAFIVLMASPAGGKFSDGIIKQDSMGARAKGANDHETVTIINWCQRFYNIVLNEENQDVARKKMQQLYNERTGEEKEAFEKTGLGGGTLDIDYALTPHFKYFLSLNPDDFLKNVRCPVLALMGDKDVSGPSKQILKAIENSLKSGGNKTYRVQELNNLNHHFQTVRDDNTGDIEETISPFVLDVITSWIKEQNGIQ
jgi:uncharacterized protein